MKSSTIDLTFPPISLNLLPYPCPLPSCFSLTPYFCDYFHPSSKDFIWQIGLETDLKLWNQTILVETGKTSDYYRS